MRQGARSVAGLVTAALVLVGCSGDDGDTATTLPPLTSAPSATTSTDVPTNTSPLPTDQLPPTSDATLPDEHVPEAEDVVVQLLDALNEATASGDFSSFDALYTDACTECIRLRTEVEGWLSDGRTVVGGQWVVLQTSAMLRNGGNRASVRFLMYRSPTAINDVDGNEEVSLPGTAVQLGSAGLVASEPWTVEAIGYQDAPG